MGKSKLINVCDKTIGTKFNEKLERNSSKKDWFSLITSQRGEYIDKLIECFKLQYFYYLFVRILFFHITYFRLIMSCCIFYHTSFNATYLHDRSL